MKIKTKTKKIMLVWLLSFFVFGSYLATIFYLANVFGAVAAFIFAGAGVFATFSAVGYANEQ